MNGMLKSTGFLKKIFTPFLLIPLILFLSFSMRSGICQEPNNNQDLDVKVRNFLESRKGDWHDWNIPYSDGKILYDLVVKNQYTKEPHEATTIQGKCWRNGLMTITSGNYGNVFRIAPPLCISKAQVEKSLSIFEQALKDEEEFLKLGTSAPPG